MKLIFIYGPPAAGKLTVANELAKLTGFRVLHNHAVINNVVPLFPFGDEKLGTIRRRVTRTIRIELYEAAAEANISFITTFGAAGPEYFDFYRDTIKVVTNKGGKVLFVQLLPTKEALLQRVEQTSRKEIKKIDSKEFLSQRLDEQPETFSKFPDTKHLTIDNTHLTALQAAQMIVDHYKLEQF